MPKFSLGWLNRVAAARSKSRVASDDTKYTDFPYRFGGFVEVMPKVGAVIVRWKRGAIGWGNVDIDRDHPILHRATFAIVENSALDGDATWPRSLNGRVDPSGGSTVLDYPGGMVALLKSLRSAVDAYTVGMRRGDTLVFNFEPNHGFITSEAQIKKYLDLEDLAEIMASLKKYADEQGVTETRAAQILESMWTEIFRKLTRYVRELGFKCGLYAPNRMAREHTALFDVRAVPAYCRNDDGSGATNFKAIEDNLAGEFRKASERGKEIMVLVFATCVSPHSRVGRKMTNADMVGVSNAIISAANTHKLKSEPEVRFWTGPSSSEIRRTERVIEIYGDLTGGVMGEDSVPDQNTTDRKESK